jgi:hypothetical protein
MMQPGSGHYSLAIRSPVFAAPTTCFFLLPCCWTGFICCTGDLVLFARRAEVQWHLLPGGSQTGWLLVSQLLFSGGDTWRQHMMLTMQPGSDQTTWKAASSGECYVCPKIVMCYEELRIIKGYVYKKTPYESHGTNSKISREIGKIYWELVWSLRLKNLINRVFTILLWDCSQPNICYQNKTLIFWELSASVCGSNDGIYQCPAEWTLLELMNPSYGSSCRGSDLILQLTRMFTRLAYHGCST